MGGAACDVGWLGEVEGTGREEKAQMEESRGEGAAGERWTGRGVREGEREMEMGGKREDGGESSGYLETVDPDVAKEQLAVQAEGPHPVVVGGHDGIVTLWRFGGLEIRTWGLLRKSGVGPLRKM